MTAIAGVISSCVESSRIDQTRALLNAQRGYGSDSTHLASIDGATFGASPWSGAAAAPAIFNRHLMVVADIRLDNRADFIGRLGRLGSGLAGLSDTELVLRAWAEAGDECLAWIVGDFALAVFDTRTRILTLARDPAGQVPLHYAQDHESCAFASMPAGLRPFVGALDLNRLSLAATVCDVRDDDPASHFQRIARVLPGELVRLEVSSCRAKIYWVPATASDDPLRGANLVEQYRSLLDLAVADRLKGCTQPIATHLSSGYDSSAVTATAARLVASPETIVALTSAPRGSAPIPPKLWRIGDESEVAASTAAAIAVRHIVVRETPPIRTVIRRQSLLFQEPVISVPNSAWLLQIRRQAAAEGATCLLSGASGNLSLNAGGLYALSEWARRGRWLTWARQARLAAARPDTHWRGVLYSSFGRWFPRHLTEVLQKRYFGVAPSAIGSFLRPEWRTKALATAHRLPRHANLYEARAHMIRNGNAGLLRKGGLAGEGIDERDPFADRRLLEFSLRVPPEQLYWNGVSRPLARAALADRVPAAVLDLQTRGLQSADWAQRLTREEAREMLEEVSASTTAQELFDFDRMQSAIDSWPTGDWNVRSVHATYRQSLLLALAAAMFALVHEQGSSVQDEHL